MGTRTYGRYRVEITNQDKVLFPDLGFTKGDLATYYERVSKWLIPHLRDRPLVTQRFPDGVREEGFFQKDAGDGVPGWVRTVTVPVKQSGSTQTLIVCNNTATLVYLANQAATTLHPWLSRTDKLDHPDTLVVDLDPPQDDFFAARRAALWVRDLFATLDLPSNAKLTGSRGIHVVVPLDRSASFDTVREFARSSMELLATQHPRELTTEQRKDKRGDRLYLDVTRNSFAQTTVAPYSIRSNERASVAVPVGWRELTDASSSLSSGAFTVRNVLHRLQREDDPWVNLRKRARSIRPAAEKLRRLYAELG